MEKRNPKGGKKSYVQYFLLSPKVTVSHGATGLVIIWFCPGREGFIHPFKC